MGRDYVMMVDGFHSLGNPLCVDQLDPLEIVILQSAMELITNRNEL